MNMLRDMITGNDLELVRAKLTDIDETINDTAVDVFIYDTSKDSDGGAWRHRTQHTSWYAEASSASRDVNTRSTRAEFPAVAVIVAEASKVTIYDGDDPSLPMWMVFETYGGLASDAYILPGNTVLSVSAFNGIFCVGTEDFSGRGGLYKINFLSDTAYHHNSTGTYSVAAGNLSDRNTSSRWVANVTDTTFNIVGNAVNDVAMTVLPDAPTDPATGLPVPTIAVATNGGVSVIKDDGTVVDLTYTIVDATAGHVWFREAGGIGWSSRLSSGGYVYQFVENNIPTADKATAPDAIYGNFGQTLAEVHTVGASTARAQIDGATGNPQGLTHLDEDPTTPANGMVAYTTSSYNTGWMNGDIKLAALADTTAETLSGSELVPNGDFPTGLSDGDVGYDNGNGTVDGWTALNSSLSVASNGLRVTNTAAAQGRGRLAFSTVPGKVYTLSADVTLGTSSRAMLFIYNDPGTTNLASNTNIASTGTYSLTFTALSTSTAVSLFNYSAVSGEYSDFDNVSVRLADPDRSVNGNGLGVHGSITKTAVATGADVVAYSGFNTATNYLEQPYNPDLNFGTAGDFCIMGWVKASSAAKATQNQTFVSRWNGSLGLFVRTNFSTGYLNFYTGGGGFDLLGTSDICTDTWRHVVALRRDEVKEVYVDGALESTQADSSDQTQTLALMVGQNQNNSADKLNGSLALLRISATAPTADQIRKIYEDERPLFQEDAKATLTGSSDAVTALAHDPDTGLLHVGTPGGRSVFQGLRRVEEHTGTNSQSLAAISAVDGLVVEGK